MVAHQRTTFRRWEYARADHCDALPTTCQVDGATTEPLQPDISELRVDIPEIEGNCLPDCEIRYGKRSFNSEVGIDVDAVLASLRSE